MLAPGERGVGVCRAADLPRPVKYCYRLMVSVLPTEQIRGRKAHRVKEKNILSNAALTLVS
jgi:hypothetical protein